MTVLNSLGNLPAKKYFLHSTVFGGKCRGCTSFEETLIIASLTIFPFAPIGFIIVTGVTATFFPR